MKGRLENELKITQRIKTILMTLPDYMTDFYYTLQTSAEPSTLYEYVQKSKVFLEYVDKDIKEVTTTDIGRFLEKVKYTTDKNGQIKNTSFSYQRTYWFILNKLFVFLESKNIIVKNPMTGEAGIKPKKSKDNIVRPDIKMKELNAILDATRNGAGSSMAKTFQNDWRERDFLILYLFMLTGVRKTALSEINIEDISFEKRTITVIDKRNTVQIYNITKELEIAIKNWLKQRETLLGGIKCDALFISSRRTRLCSKAVSNLVKKYSKEGIGYQISPHKLRSAFITNYFEECGHDPEATRRAVGHSDISTTMRYLAGKNNSRVEAMNFMSKNLKL